jgi:cbb3-type cytochrome c oxidase subunit III
VVVLLARAAAALTGAEVYDQGCASCHGRDGRGAPEGTAITVPLPDFTDCTVSTAESSANWEGLIRHGGAFLGLSPQMPAFGDGLDAGEIAAVIAYLRGFCRESAYPSGDLNFRRPLFVGKGFPEDEAVLTARFAKARHEREAEQELELETRVGARGWIETAVPAVEVDPDGAPLRSGVGDASVAYHHVLLADVASRSILAGGVELALPTGNRRHGVGAGTPVVAPQLRAGQALGPLSLQAQVVASLPGDARRSPREMLYRLAVQAPLGPYKKDLVPALEIEQSQGLDRDVHAATLLAPVLYVPLSRRGHVAVGVGAELPVAGTRPFDWAVAASLLWEYADGPFWAW